ncbi:hypothetical protein CBS147353_11252 [Aspergillus niger]|nr:hypothetical protein CBS147353_11252 [Aspergillus niger]
MDTTQNNAVGGDGGGSFELEPGQATTVEKITFWKDGSGDNAVLCAVKLEWFDQEDDQSAGDQHGDAKSYTFQRDERVTQMSIRWGYKVDQMMFETDKGGIYTHGGTSSGNVTSLDVGNGKIVTAPGRSGWQLDKLGIDFC